MKNAVVAGKGGPQSPHLRVRRYVNKEDLVNRIMASRSGGVYKIQREGKI